VFRNEHRVAYAELADALEKSQRGLCAFCESRLVTNVPTPARQIEHWRPKSNDATPSADWTFGVGNVHACCLGGTKRHLDPPFGTRGLRDDQNLSCGQKKGETDPESLPVAKRPYRPTEVPLSPPVFTVALDGRLSPDVDAVAEGLDGARLQATIDFLGLNCERLRIIREEVRRYLSERLFEYEREMPGPDPISITAAALKRLASEQRILPGAALPPFVSVLRDFFGPALDDEWLGDPGWPFG
jgi:uncharacterized protein (TIGR02646 family)